MTKELRAALPGDEAKDIVTGFRGIVTAKTTWLHGCDRITITPSKLGSDGLPIKEQTFDEQRIEVIKANKLKVTPPVADRLRELALGAEAKDTVSGFKGIIAAVTVLIGGDIHVQLEPEKLNKDGGTFEIEIFVADRVEVIKPKPVPQAKKTKTSGDNGGPQRGEGIRVRGR
jgi:hypothetical protein